MDEGFAVDHAPNVPLMDGLENYSQVAFENIEWDEWYYVMDTDDGVNYIVYITRHGDDPEPADFVRVLRKYRRIPGDDEFDWTDDEHEYVLDKDDIDAGVYVFYIYAPGQGGGGLAEDIALRFRNPVYTLPAGTDVLRASLGMLETEGAPEREVSRIGNADARPNLPVNMRQPKVRKANRRRSRGKKRKSGTRRRR
jgi:hypothetical protein